MGVLNRLSILQVVPSINVGTGGPAQSVPGLAAALAAKGATSCVASLDYEKYGSPLELPGVRYIYSPATAITRVLRGWSPDLERGIDEAVRGADIVHSHALWMVPGIYARRAAARSGKPLVISPRGMLDAWSLERHKLRKGLAAILYENQNLKAASLLHATSELECAGIRRSGLKHPIAVLPNGIDVPGSGLLNRSALEDRFPALRKRRWVLFLGRLDPKKGLESLLESWRTLSPGPEWMLLVAGPVMSAFGAKLRRAVEEDANLRCRVTFTGMLEGEEKGAALSNAEVFVLPTRGENFGIAISEALSYGTPVITTTAAPWGDLLRYRCGWWVGPDGGDFGEALRSAMKLEKSELVQMGERGKALVREKFSWEVIASQWLEVYDWLLSGGDAPDCVTFGADFHG